MLTAHALLIKNARVVRPDQVITIADVRLRAERITAIDARLTAAPDEHVIDAAGALMTPALFDLHIHGVGEHLFESGDPSLRAGAEMLGAFGVGAMLPTLYRVLDGSHDDRLAELTTAARGITAVRIPGFHFEGPFLALAGAGAATLPGDVRRLDALLAACDGFVRAMSISPEVTNIIAVIERLVERGIVPFVTHTRATAEQAQRAIDAGARHAAHFYDVFPVPDETEPGVRPVGVVEAFLADARCSVDFICDGVHVPPVAVRAALAAKGWDRVACITDASLGAGIDVEREFDHPWGYRVRTSARDASRIANPAHPDFNGLAGSTLTMNVGVKHLRDWTGDAIGPWTAATRTPARIARLQDVSELEVGNLADVVLWNEDLTPRLTLVNGKATFRSDGEPAVV